MLTIATVSQDTGIAKEVLRKWETRYGFPVPERDASGNRLYSQQQAERLKLIKRLLDDGLRPGQVVPLDENGLRALTTERQPVIENTVAPAVAGELIGWLQSRDPFLLHERLRAELVRLGLGPFVLERMPAMNHQVGCAWASGQIGVRDEHLYTEIVQGLVREACSHVVVPPGSPRVLLTTPSGELHTLGLLMVEAVLLIEGARCISLGAQLPLAEIMLATGDYQADIVALSFSEAFPKRKIAPLLKEMRAALPGHVQLWAGGSGVIGIDRTPRGVSLLPELADVMTALQKYCRRAGHTLSGVSPRHTKTKGYAEA